jgi:hypothetical protein
MPLPTLLRKAVEETGNRKKKIENKAEKKDKIRKSLSSRCTSFLFPNFSLLPLYHLLS